MFRIGGKPLKVMLLTGLASSPGRIRQLQPLVRMRENYFSASDEFEFSPEITKVGTGSFARG